VENVVYKDPRPIKDVALETPKGTEQKIEEKQGNEDESYIYNPTGKTDPFKSFIAIREEQEEKEKRKPKTYLETLELSQLDLVMIAISPKGRWAMVRDSKGLGHVIKEGTAVGTNGGVVFKIEHGEVIVREEYMDFRGQKRFRDITKKTPSLR
jgi:type IV pilus assembly protein PilP